MFFAALLLNGIGAGLVLAVNPGMVQEEKSPEFSGDQIQGLIRQLGEDDISIRQSAARMLERIGEPALLDLKELAGGDAELRARAEDIVRNISRELYLKRPDNRELRARWEEIRSGSFDQRREAIKAWVKDGGASPGRIDALLGLFELDPEGIGGSAVGEALSWLCAPRMMSDTDRRSMCGTWTDPQPVLKHIAHWGDWDASEKVRPKMEAQLLPPRASDQGHSYLNEIHLICSLCRITFRMDDDDHRLHWETPAESLSYWKRWWENIRKDRVSLTDLGLLKRPDTAKFSAAEFDEWVHRLGSANPRHARIARKVIKELPDALLPELTKLAAAPGASAELRTMVERLQLRFRGRILYCADRDGSEALYVMNLDGSGERKISGDLKEVSGATPYDNFRWAYGNGTTRDGKSAIHRFDLRGDGGPVKICDLTGVLWTTPDGRRLAIRGDDPKDTLHVVDTKTGKDTTFGDEGTGTHQVRWAPDGSALAWTTWTTDRNLYLLPAGEEKPVAFNACGPHCGPLAWSCDSRYIAFCRADRDGDADGWICRIELVEVSSGKSRVILGPLWTMSDPEWSPTEAKLVVSGSNRHGRAVVEVFDLSLNKVITRVVPLQSNGSLFSFCRWMPDGQTVSYHQFVDATENGKVIGEEATVFIEVPSGAIRAVNRKIPFHFSPLPGIDWLLARNDSANLLLWSYDGSRFINLRESPDRENNEVFLPPSKN